jgi:hypothetical protein
MISSLLRLIVLTNEVEKLELCKKGATAYSAPVCALRPLFALGWVHSGCLFFDNERRALFVFTLPQGCFSFPIHFVRSPALRRTLTHAHNTPNTFTLPKYASSTFVSNYRELFAIFLLAMNAIVANTKSRRLRQRFEHERSIYTVIFLFCPVLSVKF